MRKKLLSALLLFILLISQNGCGTEVKENKPEAAHGFIDLSKWDFEKQGVMKLTGKWEFYWNQLLEPKDFSEKTPSKSVEFIDTEHAWNSTKINNEELNGKGVATYRLRIKLHPNDIQNLLAIDIPDINSSSKVWIDGKLVSSTGTVGPNEQKTRSKTIGKMAFFTPTHQDVELIIQVANFAHSKGGIREPLKLGLEQQILSQQRIRIAINFFSMGAFMLMGFYHLVLFLLRRKDRSILYFGLYCVLFGTRALLVDSNYLYDLVPNFRWDIDIKLEYFSYSLLIPIFLMYFYSLYPKEMNRKFVIVLLSISLPYNILVLLFPSYLYTYINYVIYQPIILFILLYLAYAIMIAAKRKRFGAALTTITFIIYSGTIINDLLLSNNLIQSWEISSLGFLFFIGGQSFILSKKYTSAYIQNELLSKEIETTQNEIIFTLGEVTETKSKETGNHVKRVAEYSYLLALRYGMSSEEAQLLKQASPMHDLGKIGIPDHILNKPGKLTQEEYEIIKTHTTIGYDLLKHSNHQLLKVAAEIALTHHERYDGTGYPIGLAGEEIPILGRITAVADVFDALSSDRIYKKAWNFEQIIQLFKEERGMQFDPKLVDLFLENMDEILRIKELYVDNV